MDHRRVMRQSASTMSQRSRVIELYKKLIFLGREYPEKPEKLLARIHGAFMKNKDVREPEQIEALMEKGEYISRELEALYRLKKYRAMKKRYYDE